MPERLLRSRFVGDPIPAARARQSGAALHVLAGPAGAGKSTFAALHWPPGEILSSDTLREMVSGSPGDQSANRSAFAALHVILEGRLSRDGLETVVDSTAVEGWARRELLSAAVKAKREAILYVFALPVARCVERAQARPSPRRVPADVVQLQSRQLAEGLSDIFRERWRRVLATLDGATFREVRIE